MGGRWKIGGGGCVWTDMTRKMDRQVGRRMELGTEALKYIFKFYFLKLPFHDYSNHVACWLKRFIISGPGCHYAFKNPGLKSDRLSSKGKVWVTRII